MSLQLPFHLRFQICVAITQLLIPVMCTRWAPPLFENLIVGLNPSQATWVTLISLLTGFSLSTAIHLVQRHGPTRFRTAKVPIRRHYRWVLLGLAPSFAVPTAVVTNSSDPWLAALYALVGVGCAGLLIFLAIVAQLWSIQGDDPIHDLADWESQGAFLVLPLYRLHIIEPLLRRIYNIGYSPFRRLAKWLDSFSSRIPKPFGQGFLCYEDTGASKIYSDHLFALVLLLLSAALYRSLAWAQGSDLTKETMPTMAFLLMLLMLTSFAGSALVFALDAYHVPSLLAAGLFVLVSTAIGNSDHYFQSYVVPPKSSITTAERLIVPGKSAKVILAACEGGGIQAAAWTAKVLSELQRNLPQFGQHLRIVSGTSGGAVGAMFFVNSFRKCTVPSCEPSNELLNQAIDASSQSSLEAIAWGLTQLDLPRILFPVLAPAQDRGWALEETFRKRAELGDTMLSQWADKARSGHMPGIIFNATLVETGEPIVMSTARFPRNTGRHKPLSEALASDDELDIHVATAARLSASFPVVTPAARPRKARARFHVADGGYYDNPGLASLIEWLTLTLNRGSSGSQTDLTSAEVLILVIRSFPPKHDPDVPDRTWAMELTGPIEALLNVRETGQRLHTDMELDLLTRYLEHRNVKIRQLAIQYEPSRSTDCDPERIPLSWRLRKSQKECISQAWAAGHKDWIEKIREHISTGIQ